MDCQPGRKPAIRALTLGVAQRHPLQGAEVSRAAQTLRRATAAFGEAGYEVQTVRLSTRPLLSDLREWSSAELVRYGAALQDALDAAGLGFCSLGPAMPGIAPGRAEILSEVIAGHEALNCSVLVATLEGGLDVGAAGGAARTMVRLAHGPGRGLDNFRFAALACVEPGTPFFPAAYHAGPASLAVALQGAGIVAEALAGGAALGDVTERVREALTERSAPVVGVAKRMAAELGLSFGGIDLSPAPSGSDSIVAALELAGLGRFGSPGTLALAGALTAGIRSTGLPTCGYCGLMLPVMEDSVLARRWEEGSVSLDKLLAYSAVCGTGLDTIPLAGDCSADDLAKVICDVGTLAVRLHKPLSARLLPVPGKAAGERARLVSAYLVDTLIRSLA